MSTSFLSCRDVTVNLGPSTVLANVSMAVGPGDRLALVGPNGVGKTTLLRVLSGDVTPDSGAVDRPSTVGLMPQERDARGDETVRAYLGRRTGATEADAELVAATEQLAAGTPNSDQRYADALDRYLALGAADLDVRAPAVLAELGVDPERLDDPVQGLSGGQLARLALASVLLAQYDVLLLDEPTNDLDVAGLERLERFVLERTGALVLVSHDRRFLERVTTGVLEIDWYTREGRVFGGGYAAFLEERERSRQHAWEAYEAYTEKRDALVAQARRQREWTRTAVAKEKRNPSDGDKMLRDAKIERTERTMAKASAADRALERLEVVEEPRTPWELRLSLEQQARSGDRVAGLAGAVCRRGDFTLGPVDLDVRYADRLVITGPNGSGKSTLVGALLGRLPLDEGERWFGRGVVVGEIDQVRRGVDPDAPLVAAFRTATGYDETEARRLLAKFDLDADDVVRPTGSLSPGERTRADLALLVARQSNLIVLDEPTNHLDLPAVEQLEQALTAYDGTLVLVSHDRHLAEAVGATHLLHVEDGQVSVNMPASPAG